MKTESEIRAALSDAAARFERARTAQAAPGDVDRERQRVQTLRKRLRHLEGR